MTQEARRLSCNTNNVTIILNLQTLVELAIVALKLVLFAGHFCGQFWYIE